LTERERWREKKREKAALRGKADKSENSHVGTTVLGLQLDLGGHTNERTRSGAASLDYNI